MAISRKTIEEVLERANIYEVVSQFVTLKKAGRNYVGLCPFHADTKPSFTVNEEKNLFYCFGCQRGGTPIQFLMDMKNLTFVEALEELARRYGVKIEYDKKSISESYKRRQALLELNEEAKRFFRAQLLSAGGERARNYIASRGISDDVAKRFELGYAPNSWDALLKHLKAKGFSEQLAESAGLVVRGSSGRLHDRFRDRVMFPIIDAQGNTIAFGGRVIDAGEPKYLNSPETEVFKKGKTFFGLYQARQHMREMAIVVEGNFDCIVMHQHGFRGTVATLGTALTADHVRLISKYTDRLALIFDGDSAGQRALERSAELFAGQNIQPLAVVLPEGEDPDSFCQKNGAESLKELIESSSPILEHMIQKWSERAGGSIEQRASAANAVIELLAQVKDRLRRDLLLQLAADKLGINEESLRFKLRSVIRSRAKQQSAQDEETATDHSCRLSPAKTIIEAFLQFPELVGEFTERFAGWERVFENESDAWSKALVRIVEEGEMNVESLLADPELTELAAPLSELMLRQGSFADIGKARRAANDCALKMAEKKVKAKLASITRMLKEAQDRNDDAAIMSLLEQKRDINARWRALWQRIERTGS